MHALQAHYMLPVQGVQHTSHNHSQADKEDREGGQGESRLLNQDQRAVSAGCARTAKTPKNTSAALEQPSESGPLPKRELTIERLSMSNSSIFYIFLYIIYMHMPPHIKRTGGCNWYGGRCRGSPAWADIL